MFAGGQEGHPRKNEAVVVQLLSCVQLCDPMDCSIPGSPVLHYLPEFAQTHVHWVGRHDIQPSHLLLPPSPSAHNLFQQSGFFQWGSSLHQVAKVLELQLQHQSFQWIFRLISFKIDWFDLLAVQGILKSLLQHHSLKHQFFGTQPSLWLNPHIHTWLLEKP